MNNTDAMEPAAEGWRSRMQQCHARGDMPGALAVARGAVAADSGDLVAVHTLGVLYLLTGKAVDAVGVFRSLLQQGETAERFFDLAVALEAGGDSSPARVAYQQALKREPSHFKARLNLCALLLLLGLHDEAGREATLLAEWHPLVPDAWCSLGHALFANFAPRAADDAFARAQSLASDHLPASFGRVVSLAMCGELVNSVQLLAELKALPLVSDLVSAIPQAMEILALSDTDLEDLFLTVLFERYRRGEWDCRQLLERGLRTLASVVREDSRRLVQPIQAFHALAIGVDYADYLALAGRVAARVAESVPLIVRQPRREGVAPRRRLHLGYLSPAFRNHPSAYLIRDMFRNHDRVRFSVTAYCIGVDDGSEARQAVVSGCDTFVSLAALSDSEAAQRIHDDGVDVLIQFEGFFDGTRNGILAMRPAPIQVAHLGVVGGLQATWVDYRFCDAVTDQLDRQAKSSGDERFERRARFDEMYWPYGAPTAPWSIPVARCDFGLPAEAFVFCSFNNDYKVSEEMFLAWLEILKATPGSILWLRATNDGLWSRCVSCAEKHGIAPERIVRATDYANNQHLARMRLADLFLDAFDYNAHTTALDSLWMGLPVLTREGRTPASAFCSSALHALGMPELVTRTTAEYIAGAIALANDRAGYQALARKLMSARSSSTVFNTRHKVRLHERAYEMMWERHAAGLPPADFVVPPLDD